MSTTITVGAIFVILLIWLVYFFLLSRRYKKQLKKLIKNYDAKEDASKQGEDHRKRLLREGDSVDEGKPNLQRFDKSREGRRVLQTAIADSSRKDSSGKRKTSKSPRGIFRKLRK